MPTISGKITPLGDTFAVADADKIAGGYMVFADTTARDALHSSKRVSGMKVRVTGTGLEYTLGVDLTTWTEVAVAPATAFDLGLVKPDGTTCTVDINGVLTALVPVFSIEGDVTAAVNEDGETVLSMNWDGTFTNWEELDAENDASIVTVGMIGGLVGDLGGGDVTAASSFGTDNRLVRSDGTGKGVQSSAVTVDDSGNLSGISDVTASGALSVTSFSIGGTAVTATGIELNYVDGVTSAIQTQIDAKANLTGGNTFTGSQVFPSGQALIAPVLGTPTSGTLTNCTGLPEGGLSTTDITTNNATTSKHGFLKKLSNVSTEYMDGTGAWSTPAGGGGGSAAGRKFKTGKYYMTNPGPQQDSTFTPVLNTVSYHPFPVGEALSIDRITCGVQTAGTATSVVRLGIYSDTDGVPNALLLDAGTVAGDSTGYKEITVNQALSAGTLYWVAVVWQTAAVGALRGNGAGGGAEWTGQDSAASDPRVSSYMQASVTGALPANATPVTAGVSPGIPNVKIRAQ